MKGHPGKRRGIALVLAVVVLAILVVVVLQLVFTTRVEMALARNGRDDQELSKGADAVLQLACLYIEKDDAAAWDTGDSPWAQKKSGIRLGAVEADFEIRDEAQKLNIRLLLSKNEKVKTWAEEALLRLVKLARGYEEDTEEPDPEEIVERIVEWVRKGETGRGSDPGGARAGEEGAERRLISIAELTFLDGITREMVFGVPGSEEEEEEEEEDDTFDRDEEEEDPKNIALAEVLTVWGDGRVNINTACREVLMALHPGITREVAGNIISHREEEAGEDEEAPPPPSPGEGGAEDPTAEKWFQTVAELRTVEGMIQQDKQLDILRDLLLVAGRAPVQGKDKKEDYGDAPVAVTSKVFKVVITVRNRQSVQKVTAVLVRTDEGGVKVLRRGDGVQ
jgi:type II secretory pathway component PulK